MNLKTMNPKTANLAEDLPEWSSRGPVIELAEQTCWNLIQGHGVGRLGVYAGDFPEIFPVDYYCEAGSIVFRTADGTKLRDLIVNAHVVFEIDSLGSAFDWSVTVKGIATVKDAVYTNRSAENALPHWRPVSVYRFVEIIPESISGRRYERQLHVARLDHGKLVSGS
jgi:hypothetical protein